MTNDRVEAFRIPADFVDLYARLIELRRYLDSGGALPAIHQPERLTTAAGIEAASDWLEEYEETLNDLESSYSLMLESHDAPATIEDYQEAFATCRQVYAALEAALNTHRHDA